MIRPALPILGVITLLGATGCASTQFDRDLRNRDWTDAAIAFDTDSSLHTDERALYRAAMLHSFPNRETYNPTLARTLFERLLRLYPNTGKRQSAQDHLALLNEMQRVYDDSVRKERKIQAEIARLIAGTQLLLGKIDSLTRVAQADEQQNDQLRRQIARLESEARDRDEQLRTLRAELDKLKEIDLNPGRRSGISE